MILTIIDYELECYVVKDSAPSFGKEPNLRQQCGNE